MLVVVESRCDVLPLFPLSDSLPPFSQQNFTKSLGKQNPILETLRIGE